MSGWQICDNIHPLRLVALQEKRRLLGINISKEKCATATDISFPIYPSLITNCFLWDAFRFLFYRIILILPLTQAGLLPSLGELEVKSPKETLLRFDYSAINNLSLVVPKQFASSIILVCVSLVAACCPDIRSRVFHPQQYRSMTYQRLKPMENEKARNQDEKGRTDLKCTVDWFRSSFLNFHKPVARVRSVNIRFYANWNWTLGTQTHNTHTHTHTHKEHKRSRTTHSVNLSE